MVLTDAYKLGLIFVVSLLFMLIILIIFHFFRRHRKDKLITSKYHTNLIDDDDDTIYPSQNIEMNDFVNPSNKFFINTKEKLKKMRTTSKDYSFFGWMKFVYNTNDKQVFSLCNAEGFMYLYFLRTTGFFFFIISLFSIIVFIPLFTINFFETQKFDMTNLQKLTIKNAYHSKGKLWLVLFFSFLYTFMAYYHVYNYKKKLEIIHQKVETEDSMDSDMSLHTIHIRGFNRNLSYLDAKKILHSFFDIQFNGLVSEIQVIPSYNNLMDLIDRKFEAEAYLSKYKIMNLKQGADKRAMIKLSEGLWCCSISGLKVDGEIYYRNWLKIIENMLNFYRRLNTKKNTGNAFISFTNPFIVDKIIKNKKLITNQANTFHGQLLKINEWTIGLAPPPSDIIWENIKYTKKWRVIKMILFTLILFIVCLMIVTPNKIKSELDPLINEISSNIQDQDIRKFIVEYSYPLIVVIMNSGLLPLAVYWISVYEKHYKRSYREKSILVKSFTFMIINTLFIPTFGIFSISKIQHYITYLTTSGWDYDISQPFIENCYFFMRYIVQVTFLSNSIQLLALPQYFVKKFRVFLASTEYEKFYASLIKKYFDYGFNYSFSITVFVLTLCFSTTIPLIAPFGCLFFYIKYFVDKYNLLFVYPVEFESHGNIGFIVLKFILLGIFFYQFIISNLFLKLFSDRDYAIYASFIYMGFSVIMYFISKRIFIKEQSKIKFTPDSVFEEIINKTTKTFLTSTNNLQTNLRKSLIKRHSANLGSSNITHENFLKLMKEAYIHPAEKKMTCNPIQIWNDSYSFIKTANPEDKYNTKEFEYEQIIKREVGNETNNDFIEQIL